MLIVSTQSTTLFWKKYVRSKFLNSTTWKNLQHFTARLPCLNEAIKSFQEFVDIYRFYIFNDINFFRH